MKFTRVCLFFALSATLALGQKKTVTLETLRSAPGGGASLSPIWAPNGYQFVYAKSGGLHLYDCRANSSRVLLEKLSVLREAAVKDSRPEVRFQWENRRVREQTVQWAPDSAALLVSEGGDLFWLKTNGDWKQLTRTEAREEDPKLSPDGKKVAYRIGNDLYSLPMETSKPIRLTFDGSETTLNGKLDWVYPEELDINTAYWWSPDSARIAYLQFDTAKVMVYPQVDLLKTPALEEPERYPQAGTPNSDVRLGVVDLAQAKTRWMDLGETRDFLLARVDWLNTQEIAVQRMTRVQDKLDFVAANWETRSVRKLFGEKDPYWINVHSLARLNSSSQQMIWASEKSGYRHLYRVDFQGKELGQLTKGDWEVGEVAGVDWQKQLVYYTSTEVSPLERHLYVIGFDGSNKRQLTKEAGTHTVNMSPTAEYYLQSHSAIDLPVEQTLRKASGEVVATLRARDRKVLEEFEILPTEFHNLKTSDGATLHARLIKPKGFTAGKKYPAVVMVYGGPHAQNVRNVWNGGANWDQVLAHKGFVIWQVDNRGSAGRGHLWEAKLYRNFGEIEVADQKAGVEHLVKMGFVDPTRIGMYGWSYGGYMTLNTMLEEPKLIRAGVSGAPVTNWRLYDTIYTERYMGLPQEYEDAYKKASPVFKAKNLEGKLLLIHNFGDDNVLFQNMLQMTDALQREGKMFEVQVYPQKSHGVSGVARQHLNRVMTDFFERTLAP
ncbi:MAG: S9 family peptidase [Bryobacter sp.]|nr:S9 family peptidase [Bryobacter sp.]